MEPVAFGSVDEEMAKLKGRILALAWMMPPLVFPRSLQVSRTLDFLKQLGWQSTVVTIHPDAEPYGALDERLAEFYSGRYELITVDTREETYRSPLWLRIWRKLRPPADLRVENWIFRGSAALHKVLKAYRPDVLVTFAQPWVDHLIGLRIKRKNPSLPWVAHFSDPWVDSPYSHFQSEHDKKIAMKQERSIIQSADAIVFVNKYTADLVMAKYPSEWRTKVHVVPHGYDKKLRSLVKLEQYDNSIMRVVHTGNFYGHRKPEFILRAIAELIEIPRVRSRIQFEFIGQADEMFCQNAKAMGLDDVVKFTGKMSYFESLSKANSADLLLLIDAPAEKSVFLPSKIVDYLMLERPILGITPASGASAEVLQKLGYPQVEPEDITAIRFALLSAFDSWHTSGKVENALAEECVSEFDIATTTAGFEKAITAAIQKHIGSQ